MQHFQTPFLLSPMAAWDVCQNPDARKLRVCDHESHMPATNPVIRQLLPNNVWNWTGFILPPFEKKHLPWCFKELLDHNLNINLRVVVAVKTISSKWFSRIAFSCFIGPSINPSYFLGNFLSRADLLWAKGVEWISPHPSSPSEPLSADWYEFKSESDCLFLVLKVHLCFYSHFTLKIWFRLFDLCWVWVWV